MPGLQQTVALTIALERLLGVVKRPAIELYDQPLLAPNAVDFETLDPLVCVGPRKAALVYEFEEAHLELAAGDGRTRFAGRE